MCIRDSSSAGVVTEELIPTDYVNPFIGASTSVGAAGVYHGLGKTFPGATTPYGMVQVSPNTITCLLYTSIQMMLGLPVNIWLKKKRIEIQL